MEYKEMAKVMTDEEVKTCMAILIEDSVILDIERNTIQNYIRVKYRLIGDHTLFALVDGTVCFKVGRDDRRSVSVVPAVEA